MKKKIFADSEFLFGNQLRRFDPDDELYEEKAEALGKIRTGLYRDVKMNFKGDNSYEVDTAKYLANKAQESLEDAESLEEIGNVVSKFKGYPTPNTSSDYSLDDIDITRRQEKIKDSIDNQRKLYSTTIIMTEDELKLFSEFLEQREYSSKAQKLRRRSADIKKAEQQWQNMGVISGPLDPQYHNNALKFGRTLNKSSQGEGGINKIINNKGIYSINDRRELLSSTGKKVNRGPFKSNATSNDVIKNVSEMPALTKGKVTKLRKLAKAKKVGKIAGIGAGIAGAATLGTVAYKKIKDNKSKED